MRCLTLCTAAALAAIPALASADDGCYCAPGFATATPAASVPDAAFAYPAAGGCFVGQPCGPCATGCATGHRREGVIGRAWHWLVGDDSCDDCENYGPHCCINNLLAHPDPDCREEAADELADFDPYCHPEIVSALVTAMLTDCDYDVREEAAHSLDDLEVCTPEVVAALQQAVCDPHEDVRSAASDALEDVMEHCADCGPACLPYAGGFVTGAPGAPVGGAPIYYDSPVEVQGPVFYEEGPYLQPAPPAPPNGGPNTLQAVPSAPGAGSAAPSPPAGNPAPAGQASFRPF